MKTSISKEKVACPQLHGFAIEYPRENKKVKGKRFCLLIWGPGRTFNAQKVVQKSRGTVPLKYNRKTSGILLICTYIGITHI